MQEFVSREAPDKVFSKVVLFQLTTSQPPPATLRMMPHPLYFPYSNSSLLGLSDDVLFVSEFLWEGGIEEFAWILWITQKEKLL